MGNRYPTWTTVWCSAVLEPQLHELKSCVCTHLGEHHEVTAVRTNRKTWLAAEKHTIPNKLIRTIAQVTIQSCYDTAGPEDPFEPYVSSWFEVNHTGRLQKNSLR